MAETQVSFRDFAGAIMQGDGATASCHLVTLLEVPAATADAAAKHFQQAMAQGPDFMMKAMGLRTAVTDPDLAKTTGLLVDCFGLDGAQAEQSAQALKRRFG